MGYQCEMHQNFGINDIYNLGHKLCTVWSLQSVCIKGFLSLIINNLFGETWQSWQNAADCLDWLFQITYRNQEIKMVSWC